MSFINDWFKAKYKIVPVYTEKNEICGYTVLAKDMIGWVPLQSFHVSESGFVPTNNFCNTYEDALNFLKHETTILADEEISDTKRN